MVGSVLKSLDEHGMIQTDGKASLIFDASLEESKANAHDYEDEE